MWMRGRRREREPKPLRLRFGRRQGLGKDVRDMSSGGWYEAALLDRKERAERSHDGDRMIERERWDLLG